MRSLGLAVAASLCFLPALTARSVPASTPPPAHPRSEQPQTAVDYFRRADDLTNIRMPGSPPFHMKVAFHAFPGIELTAPAKSRIQSGDGTYEEWWLAPKRWRREITFGPYHAVEVLGEGGRKFQASSDYEPLRVLMLLRALLDPIPRYLVEPQLEDEPLSPNLVRHPVHWKVRHLRVAQLSYVELGFIVRDNRFGSEPITYDLLPSGIPVRLIDRFGVVTAWSDQIAFGKKVVPRHLAIQTFGQDRLSADVAIESTPLPDPARLTLPGEPAVACMTLRPFEMWDFEEIPDTHVDMPQLPPDSILPPGTQIVTSGTVDRYGTPQEAETTAVRQEQGFLTSQQKSQVAIRARIMVDSWFRNRFRPAILDGSPCEILARTTLTSGAVTFSGGPR